MRLLCRARRKLPIAYWPWGHAKMTSKPSFARSDSHLAPPDYHVARRHRRIRSRAPYVCSDCQRARRSGCLRRMVHLMLIVMGN